MSTKHFYLEVRFFSYTSAIGENFAAPTDSELQIFENRPSIQKTRQSQICITCIIKIMRKKMQSSDTYLLFFDIESV